MVSGNSHSYTDIVKCGFITILWDTLICRRDTGDVDFVIEGVIKECEVMFEKKSTIIGKEFETDGSITMFYSLGDKLLNDLYRAYGSAKAICDLCHIQKDVTDKIFGS